MDLKIEYITPYLPYKLMCKVQGEDNFLFEFQGVSDCTWIDLHEIGGTVDEHYDIDDVFPILKPICFRTRITTGSLSPNSPLTRDPS